MTCFKVVGISPESDKIVPIVRYIDICTARRRPVGRRLVGRLWYVLYDTPVILMQLTRRATTNATQFVDVTDIFEVSKWFILVLFGHSLESNFGVNLHS